MDDEERPISLRTTATERDAYDRMAAEAGLSRHAWMKAVLNKVAGVTPPSKLQTHHERAAKAHKELVKRTSVRDGKW